VIEEGAVKAGSLLAGLPAGALAKGDWVLLPAHCRHRVTWTQSEPPTVWLAVHF
jgi:hypothetical protein